MPQSYIDGDTVARATEAARADSPAFANRATAIRSDRIFPSSRGLMLNGIGLFMGLALALGLSRWIASLLFALTPLDPLTYAAAAALIGVAVTAGSYMPARQAASLDPMKTLGSE
jgi:hypothetical protein